MHHLARAVLTGLSAVAAALATSSMTALAYDRQESLQPIPAGHSYVYYVKELDPDRLPLQGHTVTVTVLQGAGPDASVAPADASGHATGPAGPSASEPSGADGLAFFVLKTSATPGTNQWVWKDDTYTGEVTVVGEPLAGATPPAQSNGTGATGHHKGAGSRVAGATSRSGRAKLPPVAVPPLAAGILAFLLTWLLAPPLLRRYVRLDQLVARNDLALPQTSRP